MRLPPLTVIIPTHGRLASLKQTLESLVECNLPKSYRELVVIENGSQTGAKRVVEDLPARTNARYMHREQGNKSNALNAALETIDEGLVTFFDDDIQVYPHALSAYSTTAREHGLGYFYGGSVRVDREDGFPDGCADKFPVSTKGYDASDRVGRNGMVFLGFNWAAFKEDLERVGGFNPLLGPGSPVGTSVGDETDLQQRMMELGMEPVAVSEALVRHHVPEEHTTYWWLLKRKYHVGISNGIVQNEHKRRWKKNIQIVIVSVGVLVKGMSILDKEKIIISLLSAFRSIGILRGYLGRKNNKTKT